MTGEKLEYRLPAAGMLLAVVLASAGALTLVTGLFLTPERTWINILLLSNYLVGLGLGGLLLVALHYVSGARWSLPVRRVSEALSAVLPVAAVGLMAVVLCRGSLYPWWSGAEATDRFESPLHRLWLNRPFFILRSLAYLALWLVFAAAMVRNSRRQDSGPDPTPTRNNVRLSAAFLVVFGITCWLASSDWIMSLEPEWTSTIFGVYNFAGIFLSGLAAVTVLVLWLRRRSPLRAFLNQDHLQDLGTLLFAFSSFWMYTWFCQYLLIWYVNNPEEAVYYTRRWHGAWPAVGLLDLALNWGIPFVVLLFRSAKRSPLILGSVAVVILAGRCVDLFLMILPSQGREVPIPGVLEVGLLLGAVGLAILAVFGALGKAPLVPVQEVEEPVGVKEGHLLA